ncbi:unnamed protein product, partial [Rhizophagus irregularis]
GEREVNVVVEVAKTSDEDGDNSEQLINKNSLSNQDVDMIEVPGNAENVSRKEKSLGTLKNVSRKEVMRLLKLLKKTSDENGDNSEQLINKNSLSNQDVDMIEFPGNADVCVQEAGDEVDKMTKTSYLCPVYNNRGTDEENMFGEQMVNNNSESNEEDVILFENALLANTMMT